MIQPSKLVRWVKSVEFNSPCMKAALLAPFTIPIIGLVFSLLEPMPNYEPIRTIGQALEYLGLFSIGALVLGFPLALIYGFPVLWWTSRRWFLDRVRRFSATILLSMVPSMVLMATVQDINYFTTLCLVMSISTAIFAQLLLFRLENIENRQHLTDVET